MQTEIDNEYELDDVAKMPSEQLLKEMIKHILGYIVSKNKNVGLGTIKMCGTQFVIKNKTIEINDKKKNIRITINLAGDDCEVISNRGGLSKMKQLLNSSRWKRVVDEIASSYDTIGQEEVTDAE